MPLRALARINLAAIERNVGRLRSRLGGGAELCAVVKADGYGHGAVPSAQAALAGGARSLAVATAGEAAELRKGGIDARILIMGALSAEELRVALAAQAEIVAWTPGFVAAAAGAATSKVRVHVKLDTGMGRLGTRDADEALAVADAVLAAPELRLAGAMTHFATADEDEEFVAAQLRRFVPFAEELRRRRSDIIVHAANSAATLRVPDSHFDVVRCGIAIYGCDPLHEDAGGWELEPALELTSWVSALKLARPGDSVGYGRRFVADGETWLATVPIGYGDGVRRALANNLDVLIGGRRHPLVGMVSMDNITVDVGETPSVRVGDAVTLLGADGGQRVSAEEMAARIGTINYEVLCGLSPRVPRSYHRDGEPVL